MAARIAPEPGDETRRKRPGMQHKLVIVDRENMNVEGILNVESFDDEQIVLETNAGLLTLFGQGLHIRHLNLEEGVVEIDGYVEACDYEDESRKRAKGLFARLLR
ncbi:MAG: sporulation protein YabP [Bacillota bacterium]|jgi:sporulation protein YabP